MATQTITCKPEETVRISGMRGYFRTREVWIAKSGLASVRLMDLRTGANVFVRPERIRMPKRVPAWTHTPILGRVA